MPLLRLAYNPKTVSRSQLLQFRDQLQELFAHHMSGDEPFAKIDSDDVIVNVWPFGEDDLGHKTDFEVITDANDFPSRVANFQEREDAFRADVKGRAPDGLSAMVWPRLVIGSH